jgi:hypothetical protein
VRQSVPERCVDNSARRVAACTTAVSLIKTTQGGVFIYHSQTKQQINAQDGSSGYTSHLHSEGAWFETTFRPSKYRYNSLETGHNRFIPHHFQSIVNKPTLRHYTT